MIMDGIFAVVMVVVVLAPAIVAGWRAGQVERRALGYDALDSMSDDETFEALLLAEAMLRADQRRKDNKRVAEICKTVSERARLRDALKGR